MPHVEISGIRGFEIPRCSTLYKENIDDAESLKLCDYNRERMQVFLAGISTSDAQILTHACCFMTILVQRLTT